MALLLVVGGGICFFGGLAGWFGGGAVKLDPEYYTATSGLENSDGIFLELLTADRLAELTSAGKSFLVFVDQTNCVNADRMRGFLTDYITETGLKPYRIMFSDLKTTPFHDQIRYYPSTIIISNGQLHAFLDADSDTDAPAFNDYESYKTWLNNVVSR